VLLLVDALLRRADTVEVIGAALMDKAAGVGHRRIAARLGRAEATVRGWLRRFASRAQVLRVVFTALAATISTWAPLPRLQVGGVFTAAVEAIGAGRGRGRGAVRGGHGVGLAVGVRGQFGPVAGAGLARGRGQHELALGSPVLIRKPRRSAMSRRHRGEECDISR
jgi:hypothetical protein